jgi:hypothetical protein
MKHINLEPMLKVSIYCKEINNKRTKFENLTTLVVRTQVFSTMMQSLWVRGARHFEENQDLLTLEGERITFFQNVGDHTPNDTASCPSRSVNFQQMNMTAELYSLHLRGAFTVWSMEDFHRTGLLTIMCQH